VRMWEVAAPIFLSMESPTPEIAKFLCEDNGSP
jgi:hypothetical protein